MLVKEIIRAIEAKAPLVYQESYDNCGLQVGNPEDEVTGVLITLDVTEAILVEAMERKCNMIVAHHPLIFSGLKKISGRTYVERVVQQAIKNDISIYAAHTNLDNMYDGVNARIAAKLGLKELSILSPKPASLSKLYTYVPIEAAEKVRSALFAAGAGNIGLYSEASFSSRGIGTFRASAGANPTIGKAGGERESVNEEKIEVLVEKHAESAVMRALFENHPYEEVAYELVALTNAHQGIGAGMIGKLAEPMTEKDFLAFVKEQMKTDCIRHTALKDKKNNKCGCLRRFRQFSA